MAQAVPVVFSNKPDANNRWNYFLQGTIINFDTPIFALPRRITALRDGQYCVSDGESDFIIDRLCHSLRLRGIQWHEPDDTNS